MPEYSLSSKITGRAAGQMELYLRPLYAIEYLKNLHQVLSNSPSDTFVVFWWLRMYALAVMLSAAELNICQILMKYYNASLHHT